MKKENFDLSREALDKINEQYEYADERTAFDLDLYGAAKNVKPKQTDRAGSGSRDKDKAGATAKPKTKPDPKPKAKAKAKPKPPPSPSSRERNAPYAPSAHEARAAYAPQQPYEPAHDGYNGYGGYNGEGAVSDGGDIRDAQDERRKKSRRVGKKLLGFYKRFAVFIIVFGIIYIAANVGFLYYRGQLWFNEPRARDYPVRGAVITSELGDIDWKVFQFAPLKFAYIRATKGTKFIDEKFEANRKGIDESRLWAGYYHEYDFSEGGSEQAEHFINTVGDLYGDLRPVVKLTAYGVYNIRMRNADTVKKELHAFLKRIKEEYGRRAVVMCDNDCYEKYIKPYFSDQTLWIIDHYDEPPEDMQWALWEYNPRVRTEGYSATDEYYAVTVYRLGKDMRNFRKNFEIGYE